MRKSGQSLLRFVVGVGMLLLVVLQAYAGDMVVGWYTWPDNPDDMIDMRDHGANTTMVYNLHHSGVVPLPDARYWLNYADFLDFQIEMELPYGSMRMLDPCVDVQTIRNHVNRWKDYPAVRMWRMHDEPIASHDPPVPVEGFIAGYNVVKATDPDHPVTCTFASPDLGDYILGVDFPSTDTYPCLDSTTSPSPNLFWVPDRIKQHGDQAAAAGKGPPIFECQSFEDDGDEPWNWRLPSFYETRYMTFAAFTAGAQGIFYWVYPDYPLWGWAPGPRSSVDHRENVVFPIMAQLLEVEPAISSPLGAGGVTVTSNHDSTTIGGHYSNDVTHLFRRTTEAGFDDYYLIATNNSGGALAGVQFTLSGLPVYTYTAQELHQDPDTFTFVQQGNDYVLTDDFDNYEVHVYHLRGPEVSSGCPGDYPVGDLDLDCDVNMTDFSVLAENWLECNDPDDAACSP